MKKQDLARMLDVVPTTMSFWLSGKVKPSADMLFRMADLFGVSVDRLIGRTPPGAEAFAPFRALGLVVDNIIPPPEQSATKKSRK